MKKIVYFLLLALVGFNFTDLQAQTKQYYNLTWDISTPIGSYSSFISNTSLRGASFSGNVFVKENLSIGFKFGYNSYNENIPRQTYQLDPGSAITAASYNYITSTPIQVGAYYHFNAGESIEPYAGLGLGVNYLNQEVLIQDYSFYKDEWPFLMTPEVGLRYQFKNSPLAVRVNASYNMNFNTFNAWGVEYTNFQTLTFGLALSWVVK